MNRIINIFLLLFLFFYIPSFAFADDYSETKQMFLQAGESATFFDNCYGYALFPTIGKAGFVIGGAHGKGRVYLNDIHVGNTVMNQASIGFQLGAQGYSQIIFFQDKRAFDDFTSGNFEFGAEAEAVIITAAAGAKGSTTGHSATASGGKNNAETTGQYYKGMAIFTIAKGGLMYSASVSGQKFTYSPI